MILEEKLAAHIRAGLVLYRDTPLLVELVFADASHSGHPTALADGLLEDTAKRWIPHELISGVARWGGSLFPILENTTSTLTITGDPSVLEDTDGIGYSIVPPQAVEFSTLLATRPLPTVQTSWAHVPIDVPTITIRLHTDTQGDSYWMEEHEPPYVLDATGVEYRFNRSNMTGTYLLSIYTTNRDACLWYYAWLHTYLLASMQQFDAWGLTGIALGGSDVDPSGIIAPEHDAQRHLLLTASRPERALNLEQLEAITDWRVFASLAYARLIASAP